MMKRLSSLMRRCPLIKVDFALRGNGGGPGARVTQRSLPMMMRGDIYSKRPLFSGVEL